MTAASAVKGSRAAWIGTAFVFFAALGFSIKSILIKIGYGMGVDSTTLFTLRIIFSAPFFLILVIWSHREAPTTAPTRRDWIHVVILGLIGYYLASYLDFLGLQYVTAGFERLVLFLYPTIVVVLSALLLKVKIHAKQVIALVLSYTGIGLVFSDQLASAAGKSSNIALGGALVFGSAVVYSFFLIGSSRVVHRFGAIRFTAYAMLVASMVAIVQFFATHQLNALSFPLPVYGLVLAMAIFSTVLPAIFMSEGLRRVGANQAALVGSIGPVVTIVLGWLFLNETLGPLQIVGGGLVLLGVLLVSMRSSGPTEPS